MTVTRLTLAALALCCALAGAALGIGRLLPTPTDGSMIARNPCALPCFFGITPGETSREQAADFLAWYVTAAQVSDSQVSDSLITFPLIEDDRHATLATLSFEPGGGLDSVRLVAVMPVVGVGQFSDVLLAGQKPTRAFRTCDGVLPVRFLITFGAQDQIMVELFAADGLQPATPITLFDISTAGSRSLYDARASFGCSVETGWLGFAPPWRYASIR